MEVGRVATDREAGADYAGHSEGCGRSNKLVTILPEAWAVTLTRAFPRLTDYKLL